MISLRIKFLTNLKSKKSENLTIVRKLTQKELQNSETIWLKSVQASMKMEEKLNQVKLSLNVAEDDDRILRCKGRFKERSFALGFEMSNIISWWPSCMSHA